MSLYKAGLRRKGRLCAFCLDRTRGPASQIDLAYKGVHVWLCEEHASPEFRSRRGGRDFVLTLEKVWAAAGTLTRRHSLALDALLKRVRRAHELPEQPGSYAWPHLREELDGRLDAGESFSEVVADIRGRHRTSDARLPSDRTFRRWRADPRPPRGPEPDARERRPPVHRPPRTHLHAPPPDSRVPETRELVSQARALSPRSPRQPPARAGP